MIVSYIESLIFSRSDCNHGTCYILLVSSINWNFVLYTVFDFAF